MMPWWLLYAGACLVAAVLSAALTQLCKPLGRRLDAMDRPGVELHKGHRRAVPVLGGLGMNLAWLATVAGGLLALRYAPRSWLGSLSEHLSGALDSLPRLATIALGAFLIMLMGLLDDRACLSARTKLIAQIAVAVGTALAGVRITFFLPHPALAVALTAFWIVFLINAVNFLDNMDGLAAGTAMVAAFFFALVAGFREQYFVASLAAVTTGTAAGFLVHNRPPASIFMGDAGSHFLGYLLAVIAALTTFYQPGETPTWTPVLIPLLILGVPIMDLFAVVVGRLRRGTPVYVGDHTHISHRFEKMGFSRPRSVLLIYFVLVATGAGGVLLLWLPPHAVPVALLQVGAVFAAVGVLQYSPHRPPESPE